MSPASFSLSATVSTVSSATTSTTAFTGVAPERLKEQKSLNSSHPAQPSSAEASPTKIRCSSINKKGFIRRRLRRRFRWGGRAGASRRTCPASQFAVSRLLYSAMLKNLLGRPRKKDRANFQGARLPAGTGSIEYLKSKVPGRRARGQRKVTDYVL